MQLVEQRTEKWRLMRQAEQRGHNLSSERLYWDRHGGA